MEELNKTQIILLTLFITFVTSVTTGIVTVTLLEQAPPGVTQTINRVVERTIEKVTPVVTRTETKVVGQEDEIIKTASAIKPAIVRITLAPISVSSSGSVKTEMSDGMASSTQTASVITALADDGDELGTGFLVSPDGVVATSISVIPDQNTTYNVFVADKKYPANVTTYSKTSGLVLLKIEPDKGAKFFSPQFITKPVSLGQTVIVLGRDVDRYTVSVGLVSSLKEATPTTLPSFKTTARSDSTNIGGPLLTSGGLLIGLNLEGGNALPIELIRSFLNGSASTTKVTS